MILDSIENAARYAALHPGIVPAFAHLRTLDLDALEPGRVEVDGDRLFLVVVRKPGKGKSAARMECHRKYIDVQCTISGTDIVGWSHLSDCAGAGTSYDAAKDIEFFTKGPEAWIESPPGTFALFFPEDVHAPLGAEEDLFKVVIKIAVNW